MTTAPRPRDLTPLERPRALQALTAAAWRQDGRSARETAHLLGVSESTARRRIREGGALYASLRAQRARSAR